LKGIWSVCRLVWVRARQTLGKWEEDDGDLLAAAVAYYAILSLFPLLMVLASGLGLVLEFSPGAQNAQQGLLDVVAQNVSPEVADQIERILGEVRSQASVGGPLGLVVLLLAAVGIFANFEKAFDRIWNVPAPEVHGIVAAVRNALWKRLRAFLMLLGLGFTVVVVFLAGLAMSAVKPLAEATPAGHWTWMMFRAPASLIVNFALFAVIYKALPKTKIRWSEAARGGLLAALLWEAARTILAVVLSHTRYNTYGVIGSVLLVMLWIYVAASVVFLGAEYVQVVCRGGDAAHRDKNAKAG
jgi:membrane protein